MFIDGGRDQLDKINDQKIVPGYHQFKEPEPYDKKYLYIGFAIFCFLLLAVIVGVYYAIIFKKRSDQKDSASLASQANIVGEATSTDFAGAFPGDLDSSGNNSDEDDFDYSDIRAEDLTFGYFYEPEPDNFKFNFKNYSLPLNVKTEVSNYYDVSRKIALDDYVGDINKYGFAIIKNDNPRTVDNFYDAYRYLAGKEIPLVMTSDFVLYYYQNNLKQIYKEIEKTTFFDNIWDVSNRMYQMSLVRYKKRKDQIGLGNDELLEAARLECAYFATALRLMSPTNDQISAEGKNKDKNLFDEDDVQKYHFELPDFLQEDVSKELDLIRNPAKTKVKSPVFLYERNYQYFLVPQGYSYNAKLKNYYLTLRWFNSLFPLYYRSEACPSCSLDYDDWRINMIAANLISEDLANNQDLKNKWAIVYKFIAFFSGLRQDLTYLHYRQVFNGLYGEKRVEEIFSEKRQNEEYQQWQSRLAKFDFLPMEGGIARNEDNKAIIGLRFLQESYWPNDYIFNRLVGKELTPISGTKDKKATICSTNDGWRCSGFGYDIVNLIAGKPLEVQNPYYLGNTNYNNYNKRLQTLRGEIEKFNVNSWNNNIFWITLELGKIILDYDSQYFPIYAYDKYWQENKNINTVLGSWTEINLPSEKIYDYFESGDKRLGSYPECNNLNYIEPNVKLVNEIIAKNKMLIKMLNALNITKKNNIASVELINLNNKFARILEISEKELRGEPLDEEDCAFVNDFIIRYAVDKGKRSFEVVGDVKIMIESVEGIKYLGLVYKKGEKNILGLGPIFNFNENYDNYK